MEEMLKLILTKLDTMDEKIDRIEAKLDANFEQTVKVSEDVSDIREKIRYVNRRVADVELEFQGMKPQQ
jgi:uncharacterized protein YoxC